VEFHGPVGVGIATEVLADRDQITRFAQQAQPARERGVAAFCQDDKLRLHCPSGHVDARLGFVDLDAADARAFPQHGPGIHGGLGQPRIQCYAWDDPARGAIRIRR